jgi:site-specific recombinase XerD
MTTEDAIARFEREYLAYHGISQKRRVEQVNVLRTFASSLDGRSVVEATASDLQAYAGALIESGLHVNTVRTRLNMVRPFVSWAYAVGLIDADRYLRLKAVPNPRGSSSYSAPKPYTRQEIVAFWTALNTRHPKLPSSGRGSQALTRWLKGKGRWAPLRHHAMNLQITAMVRLALDMGLRRAEIYNLTVNDAHYDLEYLIVRGKADPNSGEPKIREVPFTTAARAALKDWIEFRARIRPEHDALWLKLWYSDIYDQPIRWSRFERLLLQAVGPQWRWHRFRHTCGTEWLRSGNMTLEQVSRLLGHATLQQTLGYAAILNSDIGRAMMKGEAGFEQAVGHAA